jgi:hypothetical protein
MSNAMMVIYPYREQYTWVFDDERVGLVREPFVQGVPEMINVLVADIPNAAQGFRLLFSANPFPGYQAEMLWLKEEYGGNWYRWESKNLEGWLCPALLKYFPEAPPSFTAKLKKCNNQQQVNEKLVNL